MTRFQSKSDALMAYRAQLHKYDLNNIRNALSVKYGIDINYGNVQD